MFFSSDLSPCLTYRELKLGRHSHEEHLIDDDEPGSLWHDDEHSAEVSDGALVRGPLLEHARHGEGHQLLCGECHVEGERVDVVRCLGELVEQ